MYSFITIYPFEYPRNFTCTSRSARPALSGNAIALTTFLGIYELIMNILDQEQVRKEGRKQVCSPT